MKTKTLQEVVRAAEQNLKQGSVTISKHVQWSMLDTLNTIDAYINSRHISGSTDSLGREKPFFNIVTAATNIWYRATDIDRKDIRIVPTTTDTVGAALIATVHLKEWMNKARFGVFLNEWGRTLAKYGSAVVKFVEQDGELIANVVPWNRFIADPIDFDAISHIEKFYKTEEQLYRMAKERGYDKDKVEALCNALQTRKTTEDQQQDNQANFVELYEIHGRMSLKTFLEAQGQEASDEDDDIYFNQMHVVSFIARENGEYEDYTLFSGREAQDPYMITHLIKEDGRTLSIGAVEYLFDAQWMQNHTVKNMKDTLDLASKLIFQTSDATYVGQNVLSAIETGDIFIHKVNEPLTRIANDKPDVSAMQNYRQMWANLGQELTSTPDALRGNTMPSGTPYALGQMLAQQSQSLFEIMTENKGLAIEDMMRAFVIPYIKKKLNNKDEILATLDEVDIQEIDAKFVPNQAIRNYNDNFAETVLSGGIPSPYNPQEAQQPIKEQLAQMGNKRSFKPDEIGEMTWKEAFKDLEWKVEVRVTNETTDQQAVLTTLSTALQTIASNPAVLQDPNAKMLFQAILTETGKISPMQIASVTPVPSGQPMLPNGGSIGGELQPNQ